MYNILTYCDIELEKEIIIIIYIFVSCINKYCNYSGKIITKYFLCCDDKLEFDFKTYLNILAVSLLYTKIHN